jgi:drug/metabolite transporter (DMT)-like permease
MSSIELPHWLMIAGALLVVAGVVGLALSRNKEDEADPVVLPGDAPWRGLRSDSPSGRKP